MKNNRTCTICGKGYYLCPTCKKSDLDIWKLHTCTSEHYKVYNVIWGYTTGVFTKTEAEERLSNIDMSDEDSFRDEIKAVLAEILGSTEQKEKAVEDSEIESKSTKKKRTKNS